MTDDPPRLILGRFRPVDLARLLLVVLPSVPGLLFLTVGLVLDLRGRTPGTTPAGQAAQARATVQARELFLAGAVTLFAGTLGMAAVVWKIARTRPEEVEETLVPNHDGKT